MSDNTKLEVTLYDSQGEETANFYGDYAVDYVSLVTGDTYGPPAVIAPGPAGTPRAAIGQRVLYINTRHVPSFEIVRVNA